jgi:hypothetical protein
MNEQVRWFLAEQVMEASHSRPEGKKAGSRKRHDEPSSARGPYKASLILVPCGRSAHCLLGPLCLPSFPHIPTGCHFLLLFFLLSPYR